MTNRAHAPSKALVTTLRVAVSGVAIAVAARALAWDNALLSVLWLEFGWSEASAQWLVYGGSYCLLACAALVWIPRTQQSTWFVAVWIAAVTAATASQSGKYPWLVPFAHAVRFAVPVALGLALALRSRSACAVLRVSAAATFAAHGLEAIFQEPAFFDYLFVFSRDFLGDPWSAATIEHTLVAIGVLDLVVAALVLVTRGRLVPAWMVFWGVLTAFARIVHSGPQAWDEVALRFPNFLVPLALVWAACPRTDRQPSPDP